jgi:transcriptional regulator with XRE-family HTH domain
MKSENLQTRTANELGALLRHWRDLRGKSQFDLSLDTGVSQKQISFVESGRSVPNRQTLMVIAQALDIPLRVTRCCSRVAMPRSIPRATGTLWK